MQIQYLKGFYFMLHSLFALAKTDICNFIDGCGQWDLTLHMRLVDMVIIALERWNTPILWFPDLADVYFKVLLSLIKEI